MSQKSLEVQRLEALLLKREKETRAIEDQLNRARSSTVAAPIDLDPTLGDYQVATFRPSINNHGRSRSNTVPRSASGVGVPVDVGLKTEPGQSQILDQARPMKRSKTAHHPAPTPTSSAGKMARSASNASHGSAMATANTHSFVPKGSSVAVAPQYHSIPRNSFSGPVMMENYLTRDQQQPVSAYLHGNPQALYSAHGLSLGLPTEPLVNDGRALDPAEFLFMRGDDDGLSTTSPVQIPTGSLLSPQSAYFSANSGIPSACGSMTSGPTIETPPMTRSNSNMNDNASISGNFTEMLRIESQQSSQGYTHHDSFGHLSQATNQPRKRSAMLEPDFLAMGSNLNDFSNMYGSSAPLDSDLFQHQHAMERSSSQESTSSSSSSNDLDAGPDSANQPLSQHMERSVSNTSIRSNQSLKIRAQDALRRQNVHAKSRNLFPKPACGDVKKEHVEPSLSKPKDGKTAIAKAKYERPKHPKVKCEQCNENPEGFRGEHELRRHTEAKHKSTIKKWICRDPDDAGLHHTEAALKPLRDCKQCMQKKQYGAYYNAAAHLRRTHFKVKPARKSASRGPNAASQLDDERRGGKGGGDWPSMAELKLWMVEISVHMDQEGALAPDNVDSVDALDQEDMDNERAEALAYGSQTNLGVNIGQDAYDMTTACAGVGGGFGHDLDHHSFQALQADFGSQNPELYLDPLYAQSSLHRMPLSSSSFDFSQSPTQQTQHHMASSMMSIDGHSYASPVSSTATITQTGGFGDHQMLASSNLLLSRDDLADMPFDLAFATTR